MRNQHLLDNNIDFKTRTILLNEGIDDDALDLILKSFLLLGKGPIRILLNSGGGDVSPGLAICDLIQKHPSKVTVEVVGRAESMAAVIMQAADIRKMHKNSHIMIHAGVEEPQADLKKNIKNYLKLTDKFDNACDDLVLRQIQKKHRKYSWTKFREETQFDIYFSADQALQWGLVDRII